MQVIQKHSKRRGFALLDAVAASIVTVMVIVPAVTMMRRSIETTRRLQTRQEMTLQCSCLLEHQLAQQADSFRSRKQKGILKYEESQLGYQIECSDRSRFGGTPGRLMGVSVTVWHDLNKDRRKGRSEPGVMLYSKALNTSVMNSLSAALTPPPAAPGS